MRVYLPKTVSEQLSDNAFIKCFVNLDLIYNLSTDAFTVMHSAPWLQYSKVKKSLFKSMGESLNKILIKCNCPENTFGSACPQKYMIIHEERKYNHPRNI